MYPNTNQRKPQNLVVVVIPREMLRKRLDLIDESNENICLKTLKCYRITNPMRDSVQNR